MLRGHARSATQLSRPTAHLWTFQIASALALVHESCILHRDIKTSNVFVTASGDVKIGDFGLARPIGELSMAETACGTPYYLAPEKVRARDLPVISP